MMLDYQDWIGCQVSDNWFLTKDGDADCNAFYREHYSAYRYKDARRPKLFVGPGEKLVLRSSPEIPISWLLVWRSFISKDAQTGVNCAVFRNTGPLLSSALLLEGEEILKMCWSWTQRLYTYVNPGKIRSKNPGCCFKKAGWSRCGTTSKGLLIFEKYFWPSRKPPRPPDPQQLLNL